MTVYALSTPAQYPVITLVGSAGTPITPVSAPVNFPLLLAFTPQAWATQPAALTEFANNARMRYFADLSQATQVRVTGRTIVTGAATAKIAIQYSLDGTTFAYLDGATGPAMSIGSANATIKSDWVTLATAARAEVHLRIVGIDGDATASPSFTTIVLQAKA